MINNFLLFKISTNFGIKEMFLEKIAQGGALHFIPGLGVIIQKKTISILLRNYGPEFCQNIILSISSSGVSLLVVSVSKRFYWILYFKTSCYNLIGTFEKCALDFLYYLKRKIESSALSNFTRSFELNRKLS